MRIGVFGGTFDPPHLAHLILAEEARYQLALERIYWVLTPVSPLKPEVKISPVHNRIALLNAAIDGNPAFKLSKIDIERPAPYYAYETLRLLQESDPNTDLVYLMGGDSLTDLPKWERPQDFIGRCHELGVMRRPGDQIDVASLEKILPGVKSKIRWIETPLLEISASQIRDRIKKGRPVRYFLAPVVYRMIIDQNLYQV